MKSYLYILVATAFPLFPSYGASCDPAEEKAFASPCVCKDTFSGKLQTMNCYRNNYGERFGKDQRGLCREACDRNGGMEMEKAPQEESADGRLEHRIQCRLVEARVTNLVDVEPSIWNLYKKSQKEESRPALCFTVHRSDRKTATICSADDPNSFGRYDIQDKITRIEAGCEKLSQRGLVLKDGFSVQSAHWCAHSGQCADTTAPVEQATFK